MKILFAGGGTGGHTYPIIAIARELKEIEPSLQLYFMGPKNSVLFSEVEKEGIKTKGVLCGKLRRYSGFKTKVNNLIDLVIKIPLGVIQSLIYLFFLAPDIVFSKGGYGAIPPTIAARILQIPIFLHESDASPGLANRFLSRFAIEVFTSFPKTEFFPPEKMLTVGNPVRKSLFVPISRNEKKLIVVKGVKPVLLILGGSQGSRRINNLIIQILPALLASFEVIHQCGRGNYKKMSMEADFFAPESEKESYHLFPFLNQEELRQAYNCADIVVSRAGAGSIFEIAAVSKPSILIPLPESAQQHQDKNAQIYSDLGCAIMVKEENFTPHLFLQRTVALMKSPSVRKNMTNQSSRFAKPRAAKVIAEYIIEFLR